MINPGESLAIISHPRSGSTWFQRSLMQYSLGELFNLNIAAYRSGDRIKYLFLGHGYDTDREQELLAERFMMYSEMEKLHGPVSVKIQTRVLSDSVIEFIKSRQIQTVFLERRNKFNAFWSLIIAWQTHTWHDILRRDEVTINQVVFNNVIHIMNSYENDMAKVTAHFNAPHFYYEDLLSMPDNNWFRSNSSTCILDEKSKVKISNLDQVNGWLEKAGRSEWKIKR